MQKNSYSELASQSEFNLTRATPKSLTKKALIAGSALAICSVFLISSQVFQTKQESRISMFENDQGSEVMNSYMNFLAKYGRTYASHSETSNRYKIFKEKYQEMEMHNKNEDEVPFLLEINQFSDLSEEEFQRHFTGITIPKRKQLTQISADTFLSTENGLEKQNSKLKSPLVQDLPQYVNWYEAGKVSRPYDQKSCGSCWAFTTTATLESLAAISGHDAQIQEYSVQQLIDCDTVNYGCQGGWMYDAYDYTAVNGIALKSVYKDYQGKQTKCTYLSAQSHFKNVDMVEIDGATNDELKAIVSQQPIGVGIYASGMFSGYKRGIVTEEFLKCSSDKRDVNHGVTVVGYGKVQSNDQVKGKCQEYWIIRNSWGADWGESGFFRLCMDNVGSKGMPLGTCLINKYATYPTMV